MQNVIMLEDGWAKLKTGGVQKIEEILEDMKDGVYKNLVWLATVIAQTIDVFGNCMHATAQPTRLMDATLWAMVGCFWPYTLRCLARRLARL